MVSRRTGPGLLVHAGSARIHTLVVARCIQKCCFDKWLFGFIGLAEEKFYVDFPVKFGMGKIEVKLLFR